MRAEQIKIERAHRTGPPARPNGEHNYVDKQKILYAARNKGTVKLGDQEVSFFQDFSAEVMKQSQASANANRRLFDAGVNYTYRYPLL